VGYLAAMAQVWRVLDSFFTLFFAIPRYTLHGVEDCRVRSNGIFFLLCHSYEYNHTGTIMRVQSVDID